MLAIAFGTAGVLVLAFCLPFAAMLPFIIDDPAMLNEARNPLERFPHDLTRQGFPSRRRCDSAFLLVAGGQHGWHERYHRIFGTELSQRLMVG